MIIGDVATELGLSGDEITAGNITSKKRRLLLAVHPDCKGRTHSMDLQYANFCSAAVEYGISRFGTQDQFREFWNPRSKCAATPPGGPDLPFAEREMCSGCVDCRCPCGTPARVCANTRSSSTSAEILMDTKVAPRMSDIDLGMTTEGSTERTYRRITMMDTPPSTWKQWFCRRYRFLVDNPYYTEPDRLAGQGPGRLVGQAQPDVAGMAPVTPPKKAAPPPPPIDDARHDSRHGMVAGSAR